ncbi:MAG: hypothetical protein WBB19_02735 [Desulforhopalus sp.]
MLLRHLVFVGYTLFVLFSIFCSYNIDVQAGEHDKGHGVCGR